MSFFKSGNTVINQIGGEVNSKVEVFTATTNQKLFTLSGNYALNRNSLRVIVGGVQQFTPANFTETSTNSFTLADAVPVGVSVIAIYY